MGPKDKLTADTELLSNSLISEIVGQELEAGKDQWIQFAIKDGSLYGLFSNKETGDTVSFIRFPAKGVLVECHMLESPKPAYSVLVGGANSPFIFPAEKMNVFLEACLMIGN